MRVFRADQYWSSAVEQEREIDHILGQAATVTRGDGVTVIAPPPFCAGVCADVEFVREGPTVWAVQAAASKQAGPWVNPDWHAVSGPQDESLERDGQRLVGIIRTPRGKPCETSANPCATAGSWRLLWLRRCVPNECARTLPPPQPKQASGTWTARTLLDVKLVTWIATRMWPTRATGVQLGACFAVQIAVARSDPVVARGRSCLDSSGAARRRRGRRR